MRYMVVVRSFPFLDTLGHCLDFKLHFIFRLG